MSARRRASVMLATLLAVCTWIVVIAITVPQAQSSGPQPNGDYGFFTAVAERLVAGDRLYVDIWDNKDPFVFYSIAVTRGFLGIWGAWALELTWVVVVALSAWALAKTMRITGPLCMVTSLVGAPLLCIGLPYFMGSTHLPGIALTLAAFVATMRGHPVAAGLLLTALTFFKLIMVPLALMMIAVAFVTYVRAVGIQPSWSRVRRMVIAYASGVAAVITLLILRGEFVPYLRAIIDNIAYSQAPLVPQTDDSAARWVLQHLVILANPHILAVLAASTVLLALFWILVLRRNRGATTPLEVVLWSVTASALVVGALTIAAVGKWLHHGLILAVPSVLLVILTARMFQRLEMNESLLAVVAVTTVTYVLAGLPAPTTYVAAVVNLPAHVESAQATDRFTSALRGTPAGSLAIISQGNLAPRSFDFPDWSLACRHIAQRHFDPVRTFEETLDCLPAADVVVIAPDIERREGFDRFNGFLDEVIALSKQQRTCSDVDGFQICAKS